MSFFKKIIITGFFSALLLAPSFVLAESFGIEEAAQRGGLKDVSLSQKTVPEVIGDVVGVVLSLLGVLFFLLILYAGIMWMTAFGVADKAEKAKDILIHASVGLVIVLSAYAISSFVFSRLGAGGGATPTTQTGAAITGQPCGDQDNRIWSASGECVTECKFENPTNGSCMTQTYCENIQTSIPTAEIKAGLCPGAVENICCVIK